MDGKNGYWVGNEFIESEGPVNGQTLLDVIGQADSGRVIGAVNARGEWYIMDQVDKDKLATEQLDRFERFESLPSFIYG